MGPLADPNAGERERSVGTSVRPIRESQSRGDCLMRVMSVVGSGRQVMTVTLRISVRICLAGCPTKMSDRRLRDQPVHSGRTTPMQSRSLTRHRPTILPKPKEQNPRQICATSTATAVSEVCASENRGCVQWMTVNGSRRIPGGAGFSRNMLFPGGPRFSRESDINS